MTEANDTLLGKVQILQNSEASMLDPHQYLLYTL